MYIHTKLCPSLLFQLWPNCDFSKASIICNYILNFTVNITNVFVLLLSVLFLENQKAQLRFYLFILFIFKLDFDT